MFDVTRSRGLYVWKGYGLKLTILSDSISEAECPVYAKIVTSGHYELPNPDYILVSSLYCLYCPKKFLKEVDIEIKHCYASKETLSFVFAKCNQELPYSFQLRKGCFSVNTGLISLQLSCCLLGIVSLPQPQHQLRYIVKEYVRCIERNTFNVDLVFMKDLEEFHAVHNIECGSCGLLCFLIIG